MGIDWSKAPEGATHYRPGYHYPWLKRTAGGLEFWTGFIWSEFSGYIPTNIVTREKVEDWNGEGLPPVGTICEVYHCDEWLQGEVIAHFQQRAGLVAAYTVEVGSVGSGIKHLDSAIGECFRPLRTPEQIAAEEREREINEITKILDGIYASVYEAACFIYDAGYRKQEDN